MRAFRLTQLLASRRTVDRFSVEEAARGWRMRIEQTIADEAIEMVFQPIVVLETEARAGYEALARFPMAPQARPDVWFAEAARLGMADDLELLAVRAALRQLERLPSECTISINLSPVVLGHPRLLELVDQVDAGRVILELTEHAIVDDYEAFGTAVGPLRERGIQLAVDDAGAGYASLRHILNVRPGMIKLDMSLTRDIHTDPARRALASGLQGFARSLDAQVVAEGIEYDEELEALRDLGIELGQGYLLGEPGPLVRLTADTPG
jgi:EAL domain-containing protein (putative c-di-GMP-specific phosphodiesterase class I)